MSGGTKEGHFIAKVDHELTVFANCLKPSRKYSDTGKRMLNMIIREVQVHPDFSVDRCRFAGSVGKKTSVLYPDFDVTLFLNNVEPPLGDIVDLLKEFISRNAVEFEIAPEAIKTTPCAVKASFKNSLEMDLLPACNYSQNIEEQYTIVMKQIKSLRTEDRKKLLMQYSSSLTETQLQFLRAQPGEAHQLIRLVRYFYGTLVLDKPIFGGKYLMEVITIAVYQKQLRSGRSGSMLENFIEVLRKVATLKTLRIAFLRIPTEEELTWHLLWGNQALRSTSMKKSVRSGIIHRRNFIVDPSNPWNDLAKNVSSSAARKLKIGCKEMLERLELLGAMERNRFKVIHANGDVTINVGEIFAPPQINYSLLQSQEKPSVAFIQYDYQINLQEKLYGSKIDSRVDIKSRIQFGEKVMVILQTLIKGKVRREGRAGVAERRFAFQVGVPSVPSRACVRHTVATLGTSLSLRMRNSNCNSDHNMSDVTLYVPYICERKHWAVRCSMKW